MGQQSYDSNTTAVWAGIRDLNNRREKPYDTLLDSDRLDGRTVLITGATSGLGLAAAEEMAARGARLLITARRNAEKELSRIRKAGGTGVDVRVLNADMADFSSIRRMADLLAQEGERIDVVVSNAAVVPSHGRMTVDGYEEMLQVNALAPALLLNCLLASGVLPNDTFAGNGRKGSAGDKDERTPRIVVVASEAHQSARALDLQNLKSEAEYNIAESTPRYGWTKLLLLSYTLELSRRLSAGGYTDVSVHALCPGPIASNIAREAPAIARPFARLFFKMFFQSPQIAARPVVYLASSPRIEGHTGTYQFLMRHRTPSGTASSEDGGRAVWDAFHRVFTETEQQYA